MTIVKELSPCFQVTERTLLYWKTLGETLGGEKALYTENVGLSNIVGDNYL